MSTDKEPRRTTERWGPLGVPLWAWGAGLAMGLFIGMLLFDGAVALIFAASIGTAFALAFSGARTPTRRRKD